jgi:lysozyme
VARLPGGWKARIALVVVPLAVAAAGSWLFVTRWAPARADYPVQGITVDSSAGTLDWPTVRARHADFAYIRSSSGRAVRDPAFAANWAGARQAGLRYGALHDYSLCQSPADQATLFMTTVPRDAAALPAVVRLDFRADCAQRPNRDALLSDLNTFINLIEGHSGKPAVVRVSRDFEEAYDVSDGVNRTLWLEGNFFAPTYASRPWVMWTATDMRRLDGVDRPVEWDVVAP